LRLAAQISSRVIAKFFLATRAAKKILDIFKLVFLFTVRGYRHPADWIDASTRRNALC